jgi:hypothetical protein
MARKSDAAIPLSPAPEPEVVEALAVVTIKRLGQAEHNIVLLRIKGDRVVDKRVLPDSNHDRLESCLNDLRNCAIQLYRFKKYNELAAGGA